MSLTVHERIELAESVAPSGPAPRRRLVVAAAVMATLAVVVGPMLAGALGLSGHDGRSHLTPMAQRVLHAIPGAYLTDGLVVVPADDYPDTVWANPLAPDLVDGDVVAFDVDGLADLGYLPSRGTAPAWLSEVGPADRVLSGVGGLSFACTRWPGEDHCAGALLMEHSGRLYLFHSGLSVLTSHEKVLSFPVLELGEPRTLSLGTLPEGATSATATLDGRDGTILTTRTSAPGAVAGSTLWWVATRSPVASVAFLDAHGEVLERVSPVG